MENYAENLGEILRGDRIESSLYELQMKKLCKNFIHLVQYLLKSLSGFASLN